MKRSVKGKVRQDDIHYILFVGGPLIGKMYLLEEGETIIGRAANADIAIDDNRIGRRHARVTARGTKVIIEDLNSTICNLLKYIMIFFGEAKWSNKKVGVDIYENLKRKSAFVDFYEK